jgi:hypothetical protein
MARLVNATNQEQTYLLFSLIGVLGTFLILRVIDLI